MQLTLAESAVDSIDLVLAAWSEARPTAEAESGTPEPAELGDLAAQLKIRLDETQIPLWDRRSSSAA